MRYSFKPSKSHSPYGTDLVLGDECVGGYWFSVDHPGMVYCYLEREYPGFFCASERQARSVLVRLDRGSRRK